MKKRGVTAREFADKYIDYLNCKLKLPIPSPSANILWAEKIFDELPDIRIVPLNMLPLETHNSLARE